MSERWQKKLMKFRCRLANSMNNSDSFATAAGGDVWIWDGRNLREANTSRTNLTNGKQNRLSAPLLNKHMAEYENHPRTRRQSTAGLGYEAKACFLRKALLFATSVGVVVVFLSTHAWVWVRLFAFRLPARERWAAKLNSASPPSAKLMDIEFAYRCQLSAAHEFPLECSGWKCWFWWMDAESNEWKHSHIKRLCESELSPFPHYILFICLRKTSTSIVVIIG
jgi:hypothetical protein